MKRDYITGDFDNDFKITISLLKDRKIKLTSRHEIALDFCSIYVNFDINKFNKYLIK